MKHKKIVQAGAWILFRSYHPDNRNVLTSNKTPEKKEKFYWK